MSLPKQKVQVDETLELSKLFSLKRAGMLDQQVVERYLESDTYKNVGRALVTRQVDDLSNDERTLFDMVEAI
jgi:hypothetical protein